MVAPPDNDVLWARALHVDLNGTAALAGVSLGVREAEILAVTGPRGSGKTTLLRCLSGQLVPQEGEVWFNSSPVHTMGPLLRERLRRDRFGWIGPEPRLVPELRAWENAALPLMLRGTSHRAARAAAHEWLERLDAGDVARKRPHALSQAQRQRIAIARALTGQPMVLFADEPTAPLHRADRAHALRTLTAAARSHGITVVLATHDLTTAAFADRRIALEDGRRVSAVHSDGADDADAAGGGAEGPDAAGNAPGADGASGADTTDEATGARGAGASAGNGARAGAGAGAGTGAGAGAGAEGRAECSLSV